MTPIQPTDIILDKPRKLLINNMALFKAEAEVNKLRFAKPEEYQSIDALMVASFNNMFRARGLLPMDLLLSLIVHGLMVEKNERRPTVEEVAAMIDSSDQGRAEISVAVWTAYYQSAGKNLKVADGEEEKKTTDQPTGSVNGVSLESS